MFDKICLLCRIDNSKLKITHGWMNRELSLEELDLRFLRIGGLTEGKNFWSPENPDGPNGDKPFFGRNEPLGIDAKTLARWYRTSHEGEGNRLDADPNLSWLAREAVRDEIRALEAQQIADTTADEVSASVSAPPRQRHAIAA